MDKLSKWCLDSNQIQTDGTQTHWILNLNESFELIRYRGVSLVSNDFYICSVDNIWGVPAVINTKWFQLKPNFAFYSEVEPSLIILNGFFFQKLGTLAGFQLGHFEIPELTILENTNVKHILQTFCKY